jgi:hypothetical protein
MVYLSEILYSYMQTISAYIDLLTFLVLIFFFIFPQSTTLSGITFFVLTLLYMRMAS